MGNDAQCINSPNVTEPCAADQVCYVTATLKRNDVNVKFSMSDLTFIRRRCRNDDGDACTVNDKKWGKCTPIPDAENPTEITCAECCNTDNCNSKFNFNLKPSSGYQIHFSFLLTLFVLFLVFIF